mmetsp:Transcript_16310/g.31646  ORF Transcript_16310/g.31646 Transcript_16310/m.31646 type:complete len:413 (+) Transcript_16310:153-1391(+)|eukprot:CAMPEP_0171493282 /NCGR_PEP_ID=MMETSP0958-20121227/4879_1 /TAXON_ID=87120 /ORGANISM="Aurantiochytrium limacinum, Strain ATCCMYA-1381" /LENGTH=412 /DNA_ID=CAMNT_0012026895 /DNA_START=59 /DNA_END=1297 /DNA_ORIENTATION=-
MKGFQADDIDEDLLMDEFDGDEGEAAAAKKPLARAPFSRKVDQTAPAPGPAQRKSLYPSLDSHEPDPVRERVARTSSPGSGNDTSAAGQIKSNSRGSLYPSLPPEVPSRPARPHRKEVSEDDLASTRDDPFKSHVDNSATPAETADVPPVASPAAKPKRSLASKLKFSLSKKSLGRSGSSSRNSKKSTQEENSDDGEVHAKQLSAAQELQGAGAERIEETEEELPQQRLPFEQDELAQCWFEVFREVGLSESVAKMYAIGFSKYGIDDSNAGSLTEEDLAAHGIANAQHRGIIMRLIQGLLQHQQDQAALEGAASAAPTQERPQPDEVVSWDEVDRQQHKMQAEIEKVDRLEANLAKILAGDTDRQRAFKARLARERSLREEERSEARRQFALRKAKRAIDRVQKEIDESAN